MRMCPRCGEELAPEEFMTSQGATAQHVTLAWIEGFRQVIARRACSPPGATSAATSPPPAYESASRP